MQKDVTFLSLHHTEFLHIIKDPLPKDLSQTFDTQLQPLPAQMQTESRVCTEISILLHNCAKSSCKYLGHIDSSGMKALGNRRSPPLSTLLCVLLGARLAKSLPPKILNSWISVLAQMQTESRVCTEISILLHNCAKSSCKYLDHIDSSGMRALGNGRSPPLSTLLCVLLGARLAKSSPPKILNSWISVR